MYKRWIELGLEKGLEAVEIFATKEKNLSLGLYKSKLDDYEISDMHTVKLRGIYNGKYATVAVENLVDDNIDYYLDQLIENAKTITVSEPAIIFEGSKEYAKLDETLFDFSQVPFEDKLNYIKDLEAGVDSCLEVTQVETTAYSETVFETNLVNSKGLNLKRNGSYAYGYAVGVFQREEDIKVNYEINIAHKFSDLNAVEQAKKTVDNGVAKLGGKSIPSGKYPVVFSNEKFADLLAVYSSNFIGESAYKNLTKLKDKVGEKIANDKVSLIDDPLNDAATFRYSFDDQGVACKTKKVVDKGIFTGFLHNLKTAKLFNVEPTGNAFKGISPINFYLEPGLKTFDEVLAPIKYGVYINELASLHAGVNSISGDFNLQASGFLIKDGKIDHPIKMIVVSGNFFKILEDVEEIANDLKFTLSDFGSPTVSVGELVIAGD
jgi:PmbA protein